MAKNKNPTNPLINQQHKSDIEEIIKNLSAIKDRQQLIYIKGYIDGVAGLPAVKPA